jgi:histidinol-phosphate aminotransferase
MQIIGAIYLTPGDEVIVPKNTFSIYELVARVFDGKLVFVDLDKIASAISEKTKIIFFANPNNPTGTILTSDDFAALMKNVPDGALVVVDEAYAEFVESSSFPKTLDYVKQGKNVIVLRTFSKFYGLAGLRVGFGIGKTDLIAPMFRIKMPFNVSRLAQAGALAALEDKEFLEKTYQNNLAGKRYLYAEFDKLKLDYKKTESNFIFINIKRSADELFIELMRKGVIVRPLTSFGLPEAIRVSIGTPAQNESLVAALLTAR